MNLGSPSSEPAEQRAQHLRDEAQAIDAQRVAAGGTYGPVGSHPLHTNTELDDQIAAAIRAERTRCIAIAAAWIRSRKAELAAETERWRIDEACLNALLAELTDDADSRVWRGSMQTDADPGTSSSPHGS